MDWRSGPGRLRDFPLRLRRGDGRLGLLVRLAMGDWFPPGFPYLTFFPAIIVTTYFVGARPAILCATLSGWRPGTSSSGRRRASISARPRAGRPGLLRLRGGGRHLLHRRHAQALRQLSDERERYAKLTESQDLLYRELHHRVSNNIQVVGALLRLQAAGVKDGDARHALAEAGGRIEVIAKIQRELHNRSATRCRSAPSPRPC
jgi:hypothetical protein